MTRSSCCTSRHRPRDIQNAVFKQRLITLLVSSLLTTPILAGDLPNGATVTAGQVTIGQTGSTVTVNQQSNTAIVNWNSFSVAQGNSVAFIQPSSASAILNRVTGSTASNIAGTITANGQVYLINPNGIAITPTGTVKVGSGFVASTLAISDEDFLKGNPTFTGQGTSSEVSNAGVISVGRGGYAALIGGKINNDGLISVPVGKVGLGAGETATLNLSGDGFLQVAVPSHSDSKLALIQNSGTLSANGGSIIITAATARNAARNAINLMGVVEANSVSGKNGAIVIGGGEGGNVAMSGTLSATSTDSTGGKISVTGDNITLTAARLDVSGKTGGGTINIGGDRQGKGTTPRAKVTHIDAATTLTADATGQGNGGDVVVWSDQQTFFSGKISARGSGSGAGGNAEVSSKTTLTYTGTADLSADSGTFGTLLLDPHNVIISSAADSGSGFVASADDSVINVSTLQNALATANVTVSTGSTGTQDGDIRVDNDVSWSANTTLTLDAASNIALNSNITATGDSAGLVLSYGSGKDYRLLSSKSVTLSGANATLSIGGESYQLIHSMAQLDAIDTSGLNGRYALAQNLDATSTTYNSALVGNSENSPFSGIFTGLGNTISNLTISSADTYLGLFGVNVGTLRDIVLTGAQITASSSSPFYAGALAGFNSGTIAYVLVDGTLTRSSTAAAYMGGLVGFNSGSIAYTHSAAAISAINSSNESYWGGLVGLNNNTITQSYFDGSLDFSGTNGNGLQHVGGLVGENLSNGVVTQSYASGTINATGMGGAVAFVGGIAGSNSGTLANVYATGTMNTGLNSYTGGLVGLNQFGSITDSYANNTITVTDTFRYGGLVGSNFEATLSNLFWNTDTSTSNGLGWDLDSTVNITGLTNAGMQDASMFANWDNRVWAPATCSSPPRLLGVSGVVGVSQNAVYGSTPTNTYYGAVFWNTVSGTLPTAITSTDNVGIYTLDISALNATNGAGQTVDILNLGAIVTPATLEITANDVNKVYGNSATLNGYSVQGLVNNDTITDIALSGAGLSATDNVGSYTIIVDNAAGNGLFNYNITYNNGLVNVTPAPLTITASDANKVYGDIANLSNFSTQGLVNGDTVDSVTFTSAGADSTATVGSYSIGVSDAVGSALFNYNISYDIGTLNVTPALLTISADSGNKPYGTTAQLGYTASGLLNSDMIESVDLTSEGAASTASVGSYAVNAANAAGIGLGNYIIQYVAGILTVNAAAPAPTSKPLAASIVNALTAQSITQPFLGAEMIITHDTSDTAMETAANTGNGPLMATEDPRLAGAICTMSPDFALYCSSK